jgi:hypothetical protein
MHPDRLPAVDELAAIVEARVTERQPADRLRAAIELSRELAESSDALIERYVGEARTAGMSWTEIGQTFGTSKQAVQKRYGGATSAAGDWPGPWTTSARDALDLAAESAGMLRHDYVGTEHVVLALVSAERGVAAEVLRELGVTRERMLATSCMRAGAGESPERLALMPRLKQALEHSLRIARNLDVPLADTEHLLAGIVAVPDSMAVEILRRLGVSVDAVRGALAAELGVEPARLGRAERRRRRLLAARR